MLQFHRWNLSLRVRDNVTTHFSPANNLKNICFFLHWFVHSKNQGNYKQFSCLGKGKVITECSAKINVNHYKPIRKLRNPNLNSILMTSSKKTSWKKLKITQSLMPVFFSLQGNTTQNGFLLDLSSIIYANNYHFNDSRYVILIVRKQDATGLTYFWALSRMTRVTGITRVTMVTGMTGITRMTAWFGWLEWLRMTRVHD